jgi:DNA-binding MarR family transcriptional regulator
VKRTKAAKTRPRHRDAKPAPQHPGTPRLKISGLNDLLGYHVRRAHGAVRRTYKQELASLQMTQKQTAVMWLIEQNPGVAQVTISEALDMDRATTTELIQRLHGRGLVARVSSTIDARRWALTATTAGKRLMNQVRKRVARHEERLVALFSPAELKTLRQLLDRLESLDGPDGVAPG